MHAFRINIDSLLPNSSMQAIVMLLLLVQGPVLHGPTATCSQLHACGHVSYHVVFYKLT